MIAALFMLRSQKPDEEISIFDTYDRFTQTDLIGADSPVERILAETSRN